MFGSMMLGAVLFMSVGWGVPEVYYRYFDKTVYYEIQSPITVLDRKEFAPCEVVHFRMYRKSLVDSTSKTITQLELIKDDTSEIVEYTTLDGIIIDTNGQFVPIDIAKKLSCELEDGVYYWKGVAKYYVRGIEKTEPFRTDMFNVRK